VKAVMTETNISKPMGSTSGIVRIKVDRMWLAFRQNRACRLEGRDALSRDPY